MDLVEILNVDHDYWIYLYLSIQDTHSYFITPISKLSSIEDVYAKGCDCGFVGFALKGKKGLKRIKFTCAGWLLAV
jgi:hypothetical protein